MEYVTVMHKWCKLCKRNFFKNITTQTSGNKLIDNFVQKMQLKINSYDEIVFEWIPYHLLTNIKEIGKNDTATVYLAIWENGPLEYDEDTSKYERISNKKVALKCLHNSQNAINEFLNKV